MPTYLHVPEGGAYIVGDRVLPDYYYPRLNKVGGCGACGGLGWTVDDVWNALLPQKAAAEQALGRPLTKADVEAALASPGSVSTGNAALDQANKVIVAAKDVVVAQAKAEAEAGAKQGAASVLVTAAVVLGVGWLLFRKW